MVKEANKTFVYGVSQEVMGKYNLGTKSNISKMQKLLLEKDFIERREDGLYLSDPVLQLWLRQY